MEYRYDMGYIRNYLKSLDTINNRIKLVLVLSILLFYVGDLYTTYINLQIGNIETNVLFRGLDFAYVILLKTIFVIMAVYIYFLYRNREDIIFELGLFLGAVLAMGFYVFFNNVGVYMITR